MADERRLARLARVREVERRRAAQQAAASGGEHDRMRALVTRSGDLAANYAARGDACDGASLGALFAFRQELATLNARASGDAETARLMADRARLALAAAQRRRDMVDERLELERRTISQRIERAPDLARSVNRRGRTMSPARRNAP